MNTEEILNGLSAEQQEELLKKLAAKNLTSAMPMRASVTTLPRA